MNIIEIKNNTYSAKINLSRGGNCISLYNSAFDAHLLREPDYSKELDSPFLYGMPILFPVNRISGGKFTFEGREYLFPVNEPETCCHLHGTLHQEPFTLLKQSKDSLCCAYRSYGKYLTFPHDFEIRLEYKVTEDGLLHTTEIKNLSDTNMPCLFGFHTTFSVPFTKDALPEQIFLKADVSEEIERDNGTHLPTGNILPADETTDAVEKGTFKPLKDKISRHYFCGSDRKMVLYDKKENLSIVYENDIKYDYRLIFNGGADGFICLEPQNCLVNAPNTVLQTNRKGFDFIKPNESKVYYSKISLCKGDLR